MGVDSSGLSLLLQAAILPYTKTIHYLTALPWVHWLLGTALEAFTHCFLYQQGSSLKGLPAALKSQRNSLLSSALTRLNFRAFPEAATIVLQHNSLLWIYFFNVHDGLKKIYFLLFGVIMDILHVYLDISFFIKMLHILKKGKLFNKKTKFPRCVGTFYYMCSWG